MATQNSKKTKKKKAAATAKKERGSVLQRRPFQRVKNLFKKELVKANSRERNASDEASQKSVHTKKKKVVNTIPKSFFAFKKGVVLPEKGEPKTQGQKDVYNKFVRLIVKKGVDGLAKEYESSVRGYIGTPMAREVFDAHPPKNRYKDVICNDLTRVVISDGREGDYIHANYVSGLHSLYVLTQGPLDRTTADFWRMILHLKVGIICMLCETVEAGKIKCFQYWPQKEGGEMTSGDITITNVKVDTSDPNIQKTSLTLTSGEKSLTVTQLQMKTWPDKSVPNSNESVINLLKEIRKTENPVVVHCSAGIGRTGTLVAAEVCLQTLNDEKTLDLVEVVRAIRNCRLSSVQVDVQYLALAVMIAEYGFANNYLNDSDLADDLDLMKINMSNYVASKGVQPGHEPMPFAPSVPLHAPGEKPGVALALASPQVTPTASPAPPTPPVPPPQPHTNRQQQKESPPKTKKQTPEDNRSNDEETDRDKKPERRKVRDTEKVEKAEKTTDKKVDKETKTKMAPVSTDDATPSCNCPVSTMTSLPQVAFPNAIISPTNPTTSTMQPVVVPTTTTASVMQQPLSEVMQPSSAPDLQVNVSSTEQNEVSPAASAQTMHKKVKSNEKTTLEVHKVPSTTSLELPLYSMVQPVKARRTPTKHGNTKGGGARGEGNGSPEGSLHIPMPVAPYKVAVFKPSHHAQQQQDSDTKTTSNGGVKQAKCTCPEGAPPKMTSLETNKKPDNQQRERDQTRTMMTIVTQPPAPAPPPPPKANRKSSEEIKPTKRKTMRHTNRTTS